EILRAIDSIQLTAKHQVATPANWKQGEDVIITAAVSNEDAIKRFGAFETILPYLRKTKQPAACAGGFPARTAAALRQGRRRFALRPRFAAMNGRPPPFAAAGVRGGGRWGIIRLLRACAVSETGTPEPREAMRSSTEAGWKFCTSPRGP